MKKGVVIHPDELSVRWIQRAEKLGIDVIGIHPRGGKQAPESLSELVELVKTPEFRKLVDLAKSKGMEIEYEIHAMGWLLPRSLFETHPEYFTMDEEGNRNPKNNLCVCNEEAMNIMADNAVNLAKQLYGSTNRYHFWLDDVVKNRCMCPKCRELSASDQSLIVVNKLTESLRKEIPDAKVPFLAYYQTVLLPEKVKPVPGVFLEFAPLSKWQPKDHKAHILYGELELTQLPVLMDFFGKEDAKVLEYWLDNSLFSNWKKPPKELHADGEQAKRDIAQYIDWGVKEITTFACFLGPDYEALFGEPDITPYTEAFPE